MFQSHKSRRFTQEVQWYWCHSKTGVWMLELGSVMWAGLYFSFYSLDKKTKQKACPVGSGLVQFHSGSVGFGLIIVARTGTDIATMSYWSYQTIDYLWTILHLPKSNAKTSQWPPSGWLQYRSDTSSILKMEADETKYISYNIFLNMVSVILGCYHTDIYCRLSWVLIGYLMI